jgi:hypothetical protein
VLEQFELNDKDEAVERGKGMKGNYFEKHGLFD